jgi:hypothetical protein
MVKLENKSETTQKHFVDFLLKEYDYYLQRINICQDISKSIVLRTLAMIGIIGAGVWQWSTSLDDLNSFHVVSSILVTAFLLIFILHWCVYSMYVAWLDRRMCELKLNYIRDWFFIPEKDFNLSAYKRLNKYQRKHAFKTFRTGGPRNRVANPWLIQSLSLVSIGSICFILVTALLISKLY